MLRFPREFYDVHRKRDRSFNGLQRIHRVTVVLSWYTKISSLLSTLVAWRIVPRESFGRSAGTCSVNAIIERSIASQDLVISRRLFAVHERIIQNKLLYILQRLETKRDLMWNTVWVRYLLSKQANRRVPCGVYWDFNIIGRQWRTRYIAGIVVGVASAVKGLRSQSVTEDELVNSSAAWNFTLVAVQTLPRSLFTFFQEMRIEL